MDGKIPEQSAGALCFKRARPTAFASSYVDIGAVPSIAPAIVELLACRAAIAVALRQIRKMFMNQVRAVFPVETFSSFHLGSDVPLR